MNTTEEQEKEAYKEAAEAWRELALELLRHNQRTCRKEVINDK